MKLFHTADWHLGKLVQGVYMTEDQRYVLQQFIDDIKAEQPDVVVIAGDLYDRAIPPTEAVALLDDVLEEIIIELGIPVIAIAGNHDSPGRLHFGSKLMQRQGFYITGELTEELKPVVLQDRHGEVHFHLVPYADFSVVRHLFDDETITSHQDAMERVIATIEESRDPEARHVFVGHAFVTPHGEHQDNTSDSERPLSIGGAEQIASSLFEKFHYVALGHLHRSHYVGNEQIRYAGSPLKYSISEESHRKGYLIVELDAAGQVSVESRELVPRRDLRTVEGTMDELLQLERCDDYVFVKLLDRTPVLHPMEKIRTVFPNAMHVERKLLLESTGPLSTAVQKEKEDDVSLFLSFYNELQGEPADEETQALFSDVLLEAINGEEGQ